MLLTVGDDGFPNTAYTWAVAPDARRVRFGADYGSRTLDNLKRNGKSALQIVGPEGVLFLVKGQSSMIKEFIEAAPFRISMMEMSIAEVKDQSWAGVTVAPLCYHWPEQQRAERQAMEKTVFAEMISASSGV